MPRCRVAMGLFRFCAVKLFVLVIVLGFAASAEPTKATSERRGLRNVIRVGKRYDENELWDFPTEDKRYGKLMAFPRVGRSSASGTNNDDSNERDSNPGLWFGPRIGRSPPKIAANKDDATALALILLNKGYSINRLMNFLDSRPRQDAVQDELNDYGSDEFKDSY